jgi:hypothetical protein
VGQEFFPFSGVRELVHMAKGGYNLDAFRVRRSRMLHIGKRVQLSVEFFTTPLLRGFVTSIFSFRFGIGDTSSGLSGRVGCKTSKVVMQTQTATPRS